MDVTCGTSDRVARAVVYGCGHCTRDTERSIFSLEIPEPGLRHSRCYADPWVTLGPAPSSPRCHGNSSGENVILVILDKEIWVNLWSLASIRFQSKTTSRRSSISEFWLRWQKLTWQQLVLHKMWRPVTLWHSLVVILSFISSSFINQFNVCSLLHKSLVTDPAQWAPDSHQVMSSSCLAHSNLGSCLLNRNSDTSLSSLQMSPLLVTGLWMLAVACVEASPASDTWTQTSLATKHSPQVSISCVPIFIINSVSSDESWLVCAVSGSCIWILSCILMMCSKKRTGRTKYWSIFNNKKALSLNLRPDRFRDKTFTRIHTRAWFRVYIAEH